MESVGRGAGAERRLNLRRDEGAPTRCESINYS